MSENVVAIVKSCRYNIIRMIADGKTVYNNDNVQKEQ